MKISKNSPFYYIFFLNFLYLQNIQRSNINNYVINQIFKFYIFVVLNYV